MSKSVTLSVRLSEEDAAYIAVLAIDGAVTPSDKLRAIIREARLRSGIGQGFEDRLKAAQDALRPFEQRLLREELTSNCHSELATKFTPWLAEAYAFTQDSASAIGDGKTDLRTIEAGIAARIFRLIESAARMGVTRETQNYDRSLVARAWRPLKELVALLDKRLKEDG